MNKLRSRLNTGCMLVLVSGVALSVAFKPIDSAIHWIAEESAGLKMTPASLMAIEAIAMIIMGPLVLGVLIRAMRNGWGRTFARIWSFWFGGLKSGIVSLLLFLPFLGIRILKETAVLGVVTPGSAAAWPYLIVVAFLCISAPFWSVLLIRLLPPVVLRGTLFERFSPENFDPGGEPLERPAGGG